MPVTFPISLTDDLAIKAMLEEEAARDRRPAPGGLVFIDGRLVLLTEKVKEKQDALRRP